MAVPVSWKAGNNVEMHRSDTGHQETQVKSHFHGSESCFRHRRCRDTAPLSRPVSQPPTPVWTCAPAPLSDGEWTGQHTHRPQAEAEIRGITPSIIGCYSRKERAGKVWARVVASSGCADFSSGLRRPLIKAVRHGENESYLNQRINSRKYAVQVRCQIAARTRRRPQGHYSTKEEVCS